MKTRMTLFIVMIAFACSTLLFAVERADLILFNGKVITVDPQDHIVQAVAVQGDKILTVGSDDQILPLAGPGCKIIDLKGKTVTPGLIDSHYHLMYYGAQFWPGYLDIRFPKVKSKAELLQVVGDYAKQLKPGEWVSGNQGFSVEASETLDCRDLDSVAPNNPVYLRHSSGQYSVVNSAALDTAGIDKNTPNPPGSVIRRDEQGEATGRFVPLSGRKPGGPIRHRLRRQDRRTEVRGHQNRPGVLPRGRLHLHPGRDRRK